MSKYKLMIVEGNLKKCQKRLVLWLFRVIFVQSISNKQTKKSSWFPRKKNEIQPTFSPVFVDGRPSLSVPEQQKTPAKAW